MQINFLRYGFANNSSSSHSIVFTNDIEDLRDVDVDDFGWGNFLCKSKKMKLSYMLCLLKQQVLRHTDDAFHDAVITFICNDLSRKILSDENDNLTIPEEEYNEIVEYLKETVMFNAVDHQSVFFFPDVHGIAYYDNGKHEPRESSIDMEFVIDMCKYIVNNNFVIVGGNDNDDERNPHYPVTEIKMDEFQKLNHFLTVRTTSVKDGESWHLYSKSRGSELSFSFNGGEKEANFPTLVDLKITDMCKHGCSHCYQASTMDGKHCGDIHSILYCLKNNGVGTVAIGGGNPLLHPEIVSICSSISNYMTCCITLNSIDNKDVPLVTKIMEHVDSVAVTCNEAYSVARRMIPFIAAKMNLGYYGGPRIYVQGILEFFTKKKDLVEYFRNIKIMGIKDVTLLGYKSVGRGVFKDFPPVTYDWIEVCKNSELNVGIDACIVKRYKEDIEKAGVPDFLLCNEGDRSMYIDAVKMVAKKDSYSDDVEYDIRKGLYGSVLVDAFKSFKK